MAKGGSKHVGSTNWRARFFWGTEWVYAIIGGSFEAWVYHVYTAPGMDFWLGWTEAITRAVITQILVVLLAVAAVEMWKSGAHIIPKVLGFASVQVFALLFAFVAFWLMRVAAMAFQQTDLLGGALAGTLPVPFVGDVPAQELTLDIVAALPFFQLVINLFAPIITRDHEQPTLDQLREQAERQRLQSEISQANAQQMLAGWVRVGRSLAAEVRGNKEDAITEDNPAPMPAPITPATAGITSEYDMPSDQADSNVTPLRPKGRGSMWTAADLVRHVEQTYGYTLSQGEAVGFIKAMKNAQQLEGVPGKPWAAHQATVKAWAKARSWPVGAAVTAG